MKKLNGIHLRHCKNTEDDKTVMFPLPASVTIVMAQNMGTPCTPLVAKGDKVLVGQKIGDSDAFMSVPVHSSVSGIITDVNDYLMANGRTCKAVVIETDGKQTLSSEIEIPDISTKENFIKAVRTSGACGLGGAGFPTHIKLSYDPKKNPVDTLIINAAECEPYITSDYRELMEHPDDILGGIRLLMEKLSIKYAKLCIESNKPEAIKILTQMAATHEDIDVITLPSSYPQGAEKMIIYSATGRIVPEGKLPSDVNVLVMNVSTTSFIYRYTKTGIPLISRRLTIDGNAVAKPCNMDVLIGTCINDLLTFVDAEGYEKVLIGGPMMGACLYDITTPVIKTNNAVLAMKDVRKHSETACIRCGKCISVCPMNLMPTILEHAYDLKDIDKLLKYKVSLCINCGSCSYICPAARPLAEKNQLAKILLPKK